MKKEFLNDNELSKYFPTSTDIVATISKMPKKFIYDETDIIPGRSYDTIEGYVVVKVGDKKYIRFDIDILLSEWDKKKNRYTKVEYQFRGGWSLWI